MAAVALRSHVRATPLQLGPLRLSSNLLLAPIAGYCDLAFRTICREFGGLGLACTDLLSPQGLLRGTATSLDLARTNDLDKPIGMQLYGSDPEIMAQGARWAVEHGATAIDINMGCPVDKVTKKDGGSKLLTDLPRAARIVERIIRELERCPVGPDDWARRLGDAASPAGQSPVAIPLTAKLRLCWSTEDYHAGRACSPDLARALADAGLAGITVHGRTTEMKFSGGVLHDGIARVVDRVAGRLPVIANGDVRAPADALEMLRRTGASGVMIGRGALSTPWLFRDAWALLRAEPIPAEPTEAQKVATIRRYFGLMRENRGDREAMTQIRRRISWFAKRLGPCRPLREAIRLAPGPTDVHRALDEFLSGGLRSFEHEGDDAPADQPITISAI